MVKVNLDKFKNTHRKDSATGAMTILDAIQDMPSARQLAAISTCFRIVADCCDLNVADTLTVAGNMVNDAEGRRAEFAAVEEFINNEWT